MCGRFTLHGPGDELKSYFEVDGLDDIPDRYNIAPSQHVLALRLEAGERALAELSWGLVPSWAKDRNIGYKMINARSETAREKPSFREALSQRRCIIPASGYYEWQKVGKQKQPIYVQPKQAPFLAFAGLWERWVDGDGSILESCTVLTKAAHPSFAWLHHRMPVMLNPTGFERWLTEGGEQFFQEPFDVSLLKSFPVSPRVNGVRVDDERCISECAPVVAENLELF